MQSLQSIASAMHRRLLLEAGNLPALSGNNDMENSTGIQRPADVLSVGTGSFPAFPKSDGQILMPSVPESVENVHAATPKQVPAAVTQSADKESSGAKYGIWTYVLIFLAAILLISLIIAPILVCRKRGDGSIAPWNTGLSGQLRKAFVTGKHSNYPIGFYCL